MSLRTSPGFTPVARSSRSATAQWPAVGEYSVRVPGSQSSRQRSNHAARPSDVAPSSGGSGARGKPAVCVSRCWSVTASKPARANEGTCSHTRVSGRNAPSAIATHTAAATRALVTENVR